MNYCYLTLWTHCTCMYVYILSEINYYCYYYYIGIRAVIAVWLNASQRSLVGARMNRSDGL